MGSIPMTAWLWSEDSNLRSGGPGASWKGAEGLVYFQFSSRTKGEDCKGCCSHRGRPVTAAEGLPGPLCGRIVDNKEDIGSEIYANIVKLLCYTSQPLFHVWFQLLKHDGVGRNWDFCSGKDKAGKNSPGLSKCDLKGLNIEMAIHRSKTTNYQKSLRNGVPPQKMFQIV